jgi:hypothetical protein
MGIDLILVVLARLLLPLIILRLPLTGLGVAIVADWADFYFIGHYSFYQEVDKWLDLYYLALCLIVAWRWRNQIARKIAIWLFAYRLVGVVALSIWQAQWLLLIFPNLFEPWFMFCLLLMYLGGSKQIFTSWRQTIVPLILLLIPKMLQEYILHFYQPYPADRPAWVVQIANSWPQLLIYIIVLAPAISVLIVYAAKLRQQVKENTPPLAATGIQKG